MPPPAVNAKPISSDGETWASLLALAVEAAEDQYICWTKGKIPWITDRSELCTIRLKKKSKDYYTIDLDVGAPQEWDDLIKRSNDMSKREDVQPITSDTFETFYKTSAEMTSTYRLEGATMSSGLTSLAGKVLKDTIRIDFAHKTAADLAGMMLERISKTYGYSVMQTAKCATAACSLAATAGKTGQYRLSSYSAGRVLVLAKKTGDLNANNDSSCIMAVADPAGPSLTWEQDRATGVALSKCLLVSTRLRDHLDEAEGNAVGIASAYADGCRDMSLGVEAASLVCMASVAANKGLGVVSSMERMLATGSCSIYNSIDKIAAKMDGFSPSTVVEATIVARIIMRSLACALLRDEGSMKYIMKRDQNGLKSPIYTPCLIRKGKMDYTGLTNSVYDYVLGSSQAASRMRNEAKAFFGCICRG
jgi:hypothetical protein